MYALRSRGSFNWADPSEKQWQYTSLNTPNGKNYSFVVDDELETDDVFELANNLKIIYSKYLYAGRMKDITELVELMDTEEFAIRQEKLLTEEKREQLERELYELNYYTKCYDGVK